MNRVGYILCAVSVMLTACTETKTSDAQDAYMYWTGVKAPEGVFVNRGQYWQSAHFTREYVVYLDLTAPPEWCDEFVLQNGLIQDTNVPISSFLLDPPAWFKADSTFKAYRAPQAGGYSNYYLQPRTGRMLIYEAQL